MEFESFNEGELLHIGIQEGGTAPVDTLLAVIGEKGEDISEIISGDFSEKETITWRARARVLARAALGRSIVPVWVVA